MLGDKDKDSLKYQLTRGAPLTFWLVVIAYILYRLVLVIEIVAVAALLAFVFQTSLQWLQRIVRVGWLAVPVAAIFVTLIDEYTLTQPPNEPPPRKTY